MPELTVELEDTKTGYSITITEEIEADDIMILNELEEQGSNLAFDFVMGLIADRLNVQWKLVVTT